MIDFQQRYKDETGKQAYYFDDRNFEVYEDEYVKWLEEKLDDMYHEDRFDD